MSTRKSKPALSRKVHDPRDMTVDQLSIALKNTYVLESWVSAVRSYAFDLLKAGEKIPGFSLGYGVRHRIWAPNAEKELLKRLAKVGVERDELFTVPELLSPAKVEKLLKDKKAWPSKPRGGKRPPTPIDGLMDLSMPEPKLMRIEGNTGEGIVSATEEFS